MKIELDKQTFIDLSMGQQFREAMKNNQTFRQGEAKLKAYRAWGRFEHLEKEGKFEGLSDADQTAKALRIMSFGGNKMAEDLYNLSIDEDDLAVAINAHNPEVLIDGNYILDKTHWVSGARLQLPNGKIVKFEFNYNEGSTVTIDNETIYGEGM